MKLFAVFLILMIIGALAMEHEYEVEVTNMRKNIDLPPLTYSDTLLAIAKKVCDTCPPKNETKLEPEQQLHVLESGENFLADMDNLRKKVLDSKLTSYAVCSFDKKCKKYFAVVVVSSFAAPIACSLAFLMAFVLI